MDAANHLPRFDTRWALFLDVDGTLVEFAPTPDAVKVGRRLVDMLARLNTALGGAVALVSGRPIAKLDELFDPLRLPAAGNHGLERRDSAGELSLPDIQPRELDPVRTAFERFADENAGVVVEDKGTSVALHYRLAPEIAETARRLAHSVMLDMGSGFRTQNGKMLVELRPAGTDKGDAIEAFMTEPPFAGRVPVFIGDDVTDEDGFAAVNRMGGHSVRVGETDGSVAAWRVSDIGAVLDWLEQIASEARAET